LIASPESRAALETMSSDAVPAVRASAARSAGPHSRHRLLGADRDAARRSDPLVRRAAALSAWKFAVPAPLLPGLVKALSADDARLRAGAAYALARMTSAPVAPASSGRVVGRLSDADMTTARRALVERVTDPDAEVRRQVARGLASPRAAPKSSRSSAASPPTRTRSSRSTRYARSGTPAPR
jgi:HEAT repeat protein